MESSVIEIKTSRVKVRILLFHFTNNKHIAEIFDKYPLHTYYQEVDLPLAV